jgi:hypothetical protein
MSGKMFNWQAFWYELRDLLGLGLLMLSVFGILALFIYLVIVTDGWFLFVVVVGVLLTPPLYAGFTKPRGRR